LSSLKDKNKIITSVCAVVPFYNEKESLYKILNETINYVKFIYAINDGSIDDSYQAERQIPNVKVIDHDKNYGKGKALNTGFKAAVLSGYEYIVTLDADLQHNPKYIPYFIEALKSFDIVIGNRLKNLEGMPLQRKISNRLTSFLLTVKTGQNVLDSQCGYRAYSVKVLKEIHTEYSGFEAESEILVKALKKGFNIGFVDIPTIYGNEKSKMRSLQAIFGFMKVMLQRIEG
jgi:glycosyltransferase involved in cell wall biosynthesis